MSTTDALASLSSVVAHERHRFWPAGLAHGSVRLNGVVGHRQVTYAYLAGLARANGGRLATCDRSLAALHSDVVTLIAT